MKIGSMTAMAVFAGLAAYGVDESAVAKSILSRYGARLDATFRIVDASTNGIEGVQVNGVLTDSNGVARCTLVCRGAVPCEIKTDDHYLPRPFHFTAGELMPDGRSYAPFEAPPIVLRRKANPHRMHLKDAQLEMPYHHIVSSESGGGTSRLRDETPFFRVEAALFSGTSSSYAELCGGYFVLTPKDAGTRFVRIPIANDTLGVPLEAPEYGYDLARVAVRDLVSGEVEAYAFRARTENGDFYGFVAYCLTGRTLRVRIAVNGEAGLRSLEAEGASWFF